MRPGGPQTGRDGGVSPIAAAWPAAVLFAVTIAVFAPVRDHGAIPFDDPSYVTHNAQVQAGLTIEGVRWAFTSVHAYNWHPLTWIAHMIDVELFGDDLGKHHLSSVVLHAASAAMLLLLLAGATGALWRSAVVATVFALHPLRVESVAWLSERKDTLSAFLFLLCLALWVLRERAAPERRRLLYVSCLAVYALGLLAKPMLVTLPLVLLLFDLWPLRRWSFPGEAAAPLPPPDEAKRGASARRRRQKPAEPRRAGSGVEEAANATARQPWRRLLLEKAPFLALALIVSVGTLIAQQRLIKPFDSHPLGERLVNAAVTPVMYLWKLLWPERLAIFYPYDADRFGAAAIAGCLALSIGVSIVAWRLRRRLPSLLVGWAWYLVSLAPVVGLVQVGLQARADRYTYLPQVGVLIAVVWGAWAAMERLRERAAVRVPVVVAVVAIALVLASRTRRQLATWSDAETLYRHALEVTVDNAWAHYNLAQILQRQGEPAALAEAERHFAATLELEPENADALRNLGVLAEQRGELTLAVDRFEQAAHLDPANRFAWRELGRAALRLGRLEQAGAALERAVDLGADAEASYLLGSVRVQQGRIEEAAALLERAAELEPRHAGVHNALGVVAARRGELGEARRHFARAVELDPAYAEARANLAAAGGALN